MADGVCFRRGWLTERERGLLRPTVISVRPLGRWDHKVLGSFGDLHNIDNIVSILTR